MTSLLPPARSIENESAPTPNASSAKPAWSARELAIALVAVTAIVYWNSLAGQFVFDDILQITDNPNIRRLWPMADWQRPLGYLTLQLNYAWSGLQPQSYHIVNLLIHLANAVLLFGIARRCFLSSEGQMSQARADVLACSVALLWSVHPLTTSAVTYTVQRLESLMALCFLACLFAILKLASAKHRWRWQIVAIAALTLGVLTKEVMVTCWPVALLFDRAFVAGSWRNLWQQRRGFYLALALPLAWTFITMRMTNAEEYAAGFGYQGVTPWEYLRSQPLVLLHYLRLSFWPDVLVLDYGWPVTSNPWLIYGPGLVILSLLLISLALVVKSPQVGCIALGAFLVLAPSSSIMPIADLCFEHRMYLPLMAVAALVVTAIDRLLRRSSDQPTNAKFAVVALIIVVAALGYRTTLRNADYANPGRLWEKNVAARPLHGRPHLLLAMLYDRAGRTADAGREYHAAVAVKPDYFKGLLNLGGWHFRQGNLAKAAKHFQRASEVEPNNAAGFTQWGRTLLELGDTSNALKHLKRALELDPSEPVALRAKAWLLVTSPAAAERNAAEATQLLQRLPPDPQQQDVWRLDLLAAVQAEQEDFDAAIGTAQLALEHAREQRRPAALQAQIEQRLASYQQRKPWRIAPTGD